MKAPTEGEAALAVAWVGYKKVALKSGTPEECMRAAIRAYLAALPGHILMPTALTDKMKSECGLNQLEYRCAQLCAPPAPGLEDK